MDIWWSRFSWRSSGMVRRHRHRWSIIRVAGELSVSVLVIGRGLWYHDIWLHDVVWCSSSHRYAVAAIRGGDLVMSGSEEDVYRCRRPSFLYPCRRPSLTSFVFINITLKGRWAMWLRSPYRRAAWCCQQACVIDEDLRAKRFGGFDENDGCLTSSLTSVNARWVRYIGPAVQCVVRRVYPAQWVVARGAM